MAGQYRAVILSPEIFNSPMFRKALQSSTLVKTCRTIVIDEAHCVKSWDQFRPDFRSLPFMRLLFPNITVYATTATLTEREVKGLSSSKDVLPCIERSLIA